MARSVQRQQLNQNEIGDLSDYDRVIREVIAKSNAMQGDFRDHGPAGILLEEIQAKAVEALTFLINVDPDDKTLIITLQNKIQLYQEVAKRAWDTIDAPESLQAEDAANQFNEE